MTQLGSPATESDPSEHGRQAVRGSRLARRRRGLFWVAGGAARRAEGEPGPDVVAHGGALIDEYCLVIQPVAVGRGQALFAELPAALRLELVEARSFECGVVGHIYRPPGR